MNHSEKNWDALLHAVEHPEQYSKQELDALMTDHDNADAYNLMVDAENAYRTDGLSDEEITAEWAKINFEATKRRHSRYWSKAAVVIGFIAFSGIVYAAITIGHHLNENNANDQVEQGQTAEQKFSTETITVEYDTIITTADTAPEIKEYRDASLETVVMDMAAYYGKSVSFADDDAKSIRIFFKWDRSESLEENIDKLNHFEKFDISFENDKIIVQ